MYIINSNSLVLAGILLEIVGSFFLASEALGSNVILKIFSVLNKYSNWTSDKLYRILLLSVVPFFGFLIYGFFYRTKLVTAITFPLIILYLLNMIVMDNNENVKNWFQITTKNKKISAIGFILLLFGNICQIISFIFKL